MASFVFTVFKADVMKGSFDMDGAGDTIKGRLLMSTSQILVSKEDDATVGAIDTPPGDLDECDDTGYSAQTFTTQTIETDGPNDRGEYHSDNLVFALNGDGTDDIIGCLMVKNVDGGPADIPICWLEFPAAVPKEVNSLTLNKPTEGWLHNKTAT